MTGLPKYRHPQSSPALVEPPEISSQPLPEIEISVPLSIISNSLLLREGLLMLLPGCLKAHFVGSYAGDSLKNKSALLNPEGHIVLIDSNLEIEITLEWLRFWKKQTVPGRIIVLEIANDPELILSYIEAGANAYTLQGATAAEVATTIESTRRDKAFCSPEMTAFLFAKLAAKPAITATPRPNVPLTLREHEVLRYIAEDYSNQQIAEALIIEVLTVKHHVHNILAKLKVAHRHEAARLAKEQGWL